MTSKNREFKRQQEGATKTIAATGKALGKVLPILLAHPPTDFQKSAITIDKLQHCFAELESAMLTDQDSFIAATLIDGMIRGIESWRAGFIFDTGNSTH